MTQNYQHHLNAIDTALPAVQQALSRYEEYRREIVPTEADKHECAIRALSNALKALAERGEQDKPGFPATVTGPLAQARRAGDDALLYLAAYAPQWNDTGVKSLRVRQQLVKHLTTLTKAARRVVGHGNDIAMYAAAIAALQAQVEVERGGICHQQEPQRRKAPRPKHLRVVGTMPPDPQTQEGGSPRD